MENLIAGLESKGFAISQKIRINEMLPFLQTYLKAKNAAVWSYRGILFCLLLLAGGFFGYNLADHPAWLVSGIGLAVAVMLPLIPIHELIHAAAYRAMGAKDIRFGVVWKNLMFYAGAHGFVADKRAFWWVALSPMVLLTVIGLILTVLLPMQGKIVAIMATAIHWLMCGGDIALLSYFLENRDKEVVTFDDLDSGESYFYTKG